MELELLMFCLTPYICWALPPATKHKSVTCILCGISVTPLMSNGLRRYSTRTSPIFRRRNTSASLSTFTSHVRMSRGNHTKSPLIYMELLKESSAPCLITYDVDLNRSVREYLSTWTMWMRIPSLKLRKEDLS